MERSDFIQALPKAEMHLHLEGAVPWDMVQAHARSLPSPPPWWAPEYRFESFTHFADVMRRCYEGALAGVEDYYAAARRVFTSLAAQNVRYVEISFSLGHALSRKLSLRGVVEAIKHAAFPAPLVRVFCGVSRSRPNMLQEDVVEAILNTPGLDGLDLHGDENAQGPAAFAELYAQAGWRGMTTKAHAGELAGPASIREVIDTLHVARLEHGIRAIEDERLMSRLVDEAITLDMCPTSNIKLRVVETAADYPIHQFHERGVRITVSTDNPTILGCSLTDELRLLVDRFGFSARDLVQLQRNAFHAALMPAARRAEMLTELDNILVMPSADRSPTS